MRIDEMKPEKFHLKYKNPLESDFLLFFGQSIEFIMFYLYATNI